MIFLKVWKETTQHLLAGIYLDLQMLRGPLYIERDSDQALDLGSLSGEFLFRFAVPDRYCFFVSCIRFQCHISCIKYAYSLYMNPDPDRGTRLLGIRIRLLGTCIRAWANTDPQPDPQHYYYTYTHQIVKPLENLQLRGYDLLLPQIRKPEASDFQCFFLNFLIKRIFCCAKTIFHMYLGNLKGMFF